MSHFYARRDNRRVGRSPPCFALQEIFVLVAIAGWQATLVASMSSLTSESDIPKLPPPMPMPPVSEECRVCHDVVQTFRTMFPCPGTGDPTALNFDPLHARTGTGFEEKFSLGCAFVGNCDALTGKFRARCYAMRASIEMDPKRRIDITRAYEKASNSADHLLKNSFDNVASETFSAPHLEAYDSCRVNCIVGDPALDAQCKASFTRGSCRDDLTCPEAWEHCNADCILCYWLSRTWPKFEGYCHETTPRDIEIPPPAPPLTKPIKTVGRGLRSPPLLAKPPLPLTNHKRAQECFKQWNEVMHSSQARYLVQYARIIGNLVWHPHTVCQCLGKCAFDAIESLSLGSGCDATLSGVPASMLFPDLSYDDHV